MFARVSWIVLVVAISIAILYQFVIRPIQRDQRLEDCLYGGAGSAWVQTDKDLETYKAECFKKYGSE